MTGDQLVSRGCIAALLHGVWYTQHLYWVSKPSLSLFFAPSLEVFKAKLDRDLSYLVWGKVTLPMAWGLELEDLEDPFHPKPFCGSVVWFRL